MPQDPQDPDYHTHSQLSLPVFFLWLPPLVDINVAGPRSDTLRLRQMIEQYIFRRDWINPKVTVLEKSEGILEAEVCPPIIGVPQPWEPFRIMGSKVGL